MFYVLLLAAAAYGVWHFFGPELRRLLGLRRPPGDRAGASADARARQLRTPLVRAADAIGVRTRAGAEAEADRFAIGAEGERRTADRLKPLTREGWTIRHDLALPHGRANVDHLAIAPGGRAFLPDTKRWSARYPLTVSGGRLYHGDRDVTGRLDGLLHEARAVSGVLGVPVNPIAVMDGPPLLGPDGRGTRELTVSGVRIIAAEDVVPVLRTAGRLPGQRSAASVTRAANSLKPYTAR